MSIAELLLSVVGQPWSPLTEVTSHTSKDNALPWDTQCHIVSSSVSAVLTEKKCDPEPLDISLESYRTNTSIKILIYC